MSGEALTAGRELDALVAEKVMGWRNMHRQVEPFLPPLIDGMVDPKELKWADSEGWFTGPPPYSTSIAAAWLVAEKLSVQWPVSVMKLPNNPSWQASIGMLGWIDGDTAEVAICLAALKALGVNPAP